MRLMSMSEIDSENSCDSANADEIFNDLHDIAIYGFVQDFQDWIAAHTGRELQKALMTRCEIIFHTPLMIAIDHVRDGSQHGDDSDSNESDDSEYLQLSSLMRTKKATRDERTAVTVNTPSKTKWRNC